MALNLFDNREVASFFDSVNSDFLFERQSLVMPSKIIAFSCAPAPSSNARISAASKPRSPFTIRCFRRTFFDGFLKSGPNLIGRSTMPASHTYLKIDRARCM